MERGEVSFLVGGLVGLRPGDTCKPRALSLGTRLGESGRGDSEPRVTTERFPSPEKPRGGKEISVVFKVETGFKKGMSH